MSCSHTTQSGIAHSRVAGCAFGDLLSDGLSPGYDGHPPIRSPSTSCRVLEGHDESSSGDVIHLLHGLVRYALPYLDRVSQGNRFSFYAKTGRGELAAWLLDNILKTLMNP